MRLTFTITACLSAMAFGSISAQAQDLSKQDMGCALNHSGPSCPRRYRISGGPGYTGERAGWESRPEWETNMFCSPSCVIGGTASKECSLILAFHGIYSNPRDQRWLMMGSFGGGAFSEVENQGGPFCISFHKSADVGWDASCYGDDAAHIEGFIHWALGEFPSLDPDAVNLHGFSSGAIHTLNLMDTSCPIENLVTAAAPYAGGYIGAPPTTKAALLIAHGTHDNVVPYGEGWDASSGTAVPTCAINDPTFSNNYEEFNDTWIQLFGESITAGVATFRGYVGGVFGTPPPASASLDLIDEAGRGAQKTCQAILANCVNQFGQSSSFNTDFSCANLKAAETDVINYPVAPGSNPVRLLKINIHNHDYPNRRRNASNSNPTEFFLYMRKFFNENRGSRKPRPTRTIQDQGNGKVCGIPDSFSPSDPSNVFRKIVWDAYEEEDITPESCSERCLADEECVESFYIDYQPYYWDVACHLHYGLRPCTATSPTNLNVRHYVASEVPSSSPKPTSKPTLASTLKPTPRPSLRPSSNPTPRPSPKPSLSPSRKPTLAPSRKPTSSPAPQGICPDSSVLLGEYFAGYTCADNLGDSNVGTTEEECFAAGGDWIPYSCDDAQSYFESVGGFTWEYAELFVDAWSVQCCSTSGVLSSTADIGAVAIPGGTTYDADHTFTTLYASGSDIWGTQDAFRFAYQTLNGNGVIYALVHAPSRTNPWVKSGLMIRDSLDANSANVGLFYTGDFGILGQYRPTAGTESAGTHVDWVDRTAPIWLAISRHEGRYFQFHRSEDAATWTTIGYIMDMPPMGNTVYVGVAATAHTNQVTNPILTAAGSQYFGMDEW